MGVPAGVRGAERWTQSFVWTRTTPHSCTPMAVIAPLLLESLQVSAQKSPPWILPGSPPPRLRGGPLASVRAAGQGPPLSAHALSPHRPTNLCGPEGSGCVSWVFGSLVLASLSHASAQKRSAFGF